jgi:hypothetical protein
MQRQIVILVFFVIFISYYQPAFAQIDSTRFELNSFGALSSTNFLPHYLVYNQDGRFNDQQGNLLVGYNTFLQHQLNKTVSFSSGINILAGNQTNPLRFQQLYGRFDVGALSIIGGRFFAHQTIPDIELSSGNLGISRNSLPIPKVGFFLEDFVDVPFTKGWISFRGSLFHGWFEKDRFISSPYLHEKSFYLKAGKEKYRIEAQVGFNHFVQWAGSHPVDGNLYNSFRDYVRIFFGDAGDATTSVDEGEIVNALGNHIGYWDAILTYHFSASELSVYYQHPYETKMSINPFRNSDLMVGVNYKSKNGNNRLISSITYEFLTTMEQRGPGVPDPMPWVPEDNFGYPYGGRNDLYNNYYYTNGWTYKGLVLGNPLLTTYQRLTRIGHEINRHNVEIVNNRVIANHLGIRGRIGNINYTCLNTLSRNFGTYAGIYDGRFSWEGIFIYPDFEYYYLPPKLQYYGMLMFESKISNANDIKLTYGLAGDFGQIYNNVGLMAGFKYVVGYAKSSR